MEKKIYEFTDKDMIAQIKTGTIKVWVPKPHPTFAKGETEDDVQKRMMMFNNLHAGEIEFQYTDKEKK